MLEEPHLCGLPTDVYAFGIVAIEILANASSYPADATELDLQAAALAGQVPDLVSQLTPDAQKLVRTCLSKHPQDRPTFGGDAGLFAEFKKILTSASSVTGLPEGMTCEIASVEAKLLQRQAQAAASETRARGKTFSAGPVLSSVHFGDGIRAAESDRAHCDLCEDEWHGGRRHEIYMQSNHATTVWMVVPVSSLELLWRMLSTMCH